MNSTIFREYDIRGLVPQELNPETMGLIGKAFGTHLRSLNLKNISVGGDVRTHTRGLMDAFIAAVNSTGIDVIDIGFVTSPLCYFSAFHLPVDGLAMITASHNPKQYNGVKLGVGKTTMFGSDITHIRDLAIKGQFATGAGKTVKQDITEDYIAYLATKFKFSRKIKMVLDPANATGALFAKRVFERVGADVVSIYDTVDGNFPNHHPDPTVAENVVDLGKKVVELGREVGIGLDGDSDRVGVIDEKGNLIPGDLLTLIFAKDDNHAEEIVATAREVFGKGNDFATKITYNARDAKQLHFQAHRKRLILSHRFWRLSKKHKPGVGGLPRLDTRDGLTSETIFKTNPK